jgi:hypothetical protein
MSLTPANLDFEFEFSPPQSPSTKPTQDATSKSPATPKRKRDGNGDSTEGCDTSSKRTSPLQQVATPDTLDLTSDDASLDRDTNTKTSSLTPMKRTVCSSQKSTPVTLIKGVNRVQLDSHSPPTGVELDDPFDVYSLVEPRLIDFTALARAKADSNAGSNTTARVVNLDIASDSTHAGAAHAPAKNSFSASQSIPHAHNFTAKIVCRICGDAGHRVLDCPERPSESDWPDWPNMPARGPGRPADPEDKEYENPVNETGGGSPGNLSRYVERNAAVQSSDPANPAPTPATTTTAPQYPLSALLKIPPVAPAYVPIYVSPDSPVKLRDSKQFCIKPPFWKRWPRDQYMALARYLQENVDLVPFAEQENLTVEEVQHVYHAVVVEPLLDETEKLATVGEKRIERMFKAYDKDVGKTWRKWGDGESSVEGDLGGVRPGIVQLTGAKADLIEVPWRKMTDVDKEFVWSLLPEAERAILMRDVI